MHHKKINLIIFSFLVICFFCTGCTSRQLKGIEGKWLLNNQSLMLIEEYTFVWYQNVNKTDTDYLKGKDVTILSGEEALNSIKVPDANKDKLLNTHIYYLSVTYTTVDINGVDASQQADGKLSEFAFQLSGKDQLSIVNLNTNDQYTAKREVKK